MNPYILAGLAMCLVILIALIGTGYLVVYFSRRAKADLQRLLDPLAASINGETDIDEAEVAGKRHGTLVKGRMAGAAAGTVTLWQSDLVDSAGGVGWNYVYSRPNPKKKNPAAEIDIVTESAELRAWLETWTVSDLDLIRPGETDWVQVEYSADAGTIRIARPMHGRNDIPSPEVFAKDLEFGANIGQQNRTRQEQLTEEDAQ